MSRQYDTETDEIMRSLFSPRRSNSSPAHSGLLFGIPCVVCACISSGELQARSTATAAQDRGVFDRTPCNDAMIVV